MFSSYLASSQEYYQKGKYSLIRSNPDVPLVSALDVQSMAGQYFPGCTFQYIADETYEGRSFFFRINNDSGAINITVGLYPTVQEAETVVLDRMGRYFVAMFAWPSAWEKIGDNAWYSEIGLPDKVTSYIGTIVFIRRNAVITLDLIANSSIDLRSIASAIDRVRKFL